MKLLILYYSGTGNTEFACTVAKIVAEKVGHQVAMKTYAEAGEISLGGYDAYCFAAPLQAWQPTKNVERFLKSMPPLNGKACFLITSSGGMPSQAPALMARWLSRKGMAVLGHCDLPSPHSWPVSRRFLHGLDFKWPKVERIRGLAAFTERMLVLEEEFIAGRHVELAEFQVRPTPLFFMSRFERLPRGLPDFVMGRKKVRKDECTRCGVCEENCPMWAITLDPYPVFSRKCTACWRCVNLCPEDCITTTISRRFQYKGLPDREGLLEKAGLR
jgi:ferredoxin